MLVILAAIFATLVGSPAVANELNFEELKKVPVLWAKVQRELINFRV